MKKIGKIIENSIVVIAVIIVAFFVAMMLLPKFDYSLIFIKSGSMEPTIQTGGAVIIKKQDLYSEGDIITFVKQPNSLVTHRIVGVSTDDAVSYITKGDNNNSQDVSSVAINDVKGKVVFTLPFVGYMIAFFRSRIGIILLILVPAGYFIGREVIKIKKEIKSKDKL